MILYTVCSFTRVQCVLVCAFKETFIDEHLLRADAFLLAYAFKLPAEKNKQDEI